MNFFFMYCLVLYLAPFICYESFFFLITKRLICKKNQMKRQICVTVDGDENYEVFLDKGWPLV